MNSDSLFVEQEFIGKQEYKARLKITNVKRLLSKFVKNQFPL